ncbi:hypothetical protein KAR91_58530 [Candidatus Pacearchaeota archaeon]|nr:hypothetical protein [Candidatus Pacearchaeota archaeon]
MDDRWLAINLIHAGEEDVALAMMSRDIPEGNGFDLIRWVVSEALSSSQAKFETLIIILTGILF